MATNGEREPKAEIRQAAAGLREMYLALTYEGFTETQALIVIGQILAAGQGK